MKSKPRKIKNKRSKKPQPSLPSRLQLLESELSSIRAERDYAIDELKKMHDRLEGVKWIQSDAVTFFSEGSQIKAKLCSGGIRVSSTRGLQDRLVVRPIMPNVLHISIEPTTEIEG